MRADNRVDVLVIGGGVVGCAILRELTRYDVAVTLLERQPDICDGTSKANSAIVHTGFDATWGTLEARLLTESRDLWPEIVEELGIPFLQTGAMMVAIDAAERVAITREIIPRAARNGVEIRQLSREELLDVAPYLTQRAVCGVLIEGEGIIDPFWTTRAYAENAVLNGAEIRLNASVSRIEVSEREIVVETSAGDRIGAVMVVNAAGLWSDEIARLAGDTSFTLTPRKGQFIITEEDHSIAQIILPVPNKISKGILVTPIIFGGMMLGPTAEDVADKCDLQTTREALAIVREGVAKLVPRLRSASTIRQFAGLRAVSDSGDYIIRPSIAMPRLLHVAGIRSTGLSASPAIGRYVAGLVRDALGLTWRSDFCASAPDLLSSANPDESDVICLCRAITRAEVLASLRGSLPPTTLDGLKRRTGVMLGDCQGNICIPRLLELFAECGHDPATVLKNVAGSCPVAGRVSVTATSGGR